MDPKRRAARWRRPTDLDATPPTAQQIRDREVEHFFYANRRRINDEVRGIVAWIRYDLETQTGFIDFPDHGCGDRTGIIRVFEQLGGDLDVVHKRSERGIWRSYLAAPATERG